MKRLTWLAIPVLILIASSVAAQQPTVSIPQDPVVAYFDRIFLPVSTGKVPTDDTIRAFYEQQVAEASKEVVAEDQVIEWVKKDAQDFLRQSFWIAVFTGSGPVITYDIGDPVFNDTKTIARFKVNLTVHIGRSVAGNRILFITSVREVDGVWRVVIPDEILKEIQKIPSRITSRTFFPRATASTDIIDFLVRQVTLDRELTILMLVVGNKGANPVALMTPLTLSSLRDPAGREYQTRMLKSEVREELKAGESASIRLAFFALPLSTKGFQLIIPFLPSSTGETTLTIEVQLRRQ